MQCKMQCNAKTSVERWITDACKINIGLSHHNFFLNFVIPPDSLQRKMFLLCPQRQRYVVMLSVSFWAIIVSTFYVKHLSNSSCRPCVQSVARISLPMSWRNMPVSVERGNGIFEHNLENMSRYCILVRDIPPSTCLANNESMTS